MLGIRVQFFWGLGFADVLPVVMENQAGKKREMKWKLGENIWDR